MKRIVVIFKHSSFSGANCFILNKSGSYETFRDEIKDKLSIIFEIDKLDVVIYDSDDNRDSYGSISKGYMTEINFDVEFGVDCE